MIAKCVHGLYPTDWCRQCWPTEAEWKANLLRASRATWTALGAREAQTDQERGDALRAALDMVDLGIVPGTSQEH